VSFKSSHDEKRMRERRVLAVRQKVQLLGDDAMSAAMPSRQGVVELELADGRQLRHHTRAVRGTPDNPMTRAEVDAKSYDLLEPVIGRGRARKLCDAVWNLDKIKDVRTLRPLLCA
jgi:2-methylcitrate dehydratase PrpD